jgi:hypothetical protein
MLLDMTYSVDTATKIRPVLGGQDRPFSTEAPSEGTLKLYDKNARSMSRLQEDDRCPLYLSLQEAENNGYALVRALVKRPEHLEIMARLQRGVLLVLGEGKWMILHRYNNGELILYCIIQPMADRIKIAGFEPEADEKMRHFLKGCYAGWHHMFHEVVAMASGFSAMPVYDTKIDELVQLIQVPPRFPA